MVLKSFIPTEYNFITSFPFTSVFLMIPVNNIGQVSLS
jgi:hypothetical protein